MRQTSEMSCMNVDPQVVYFLDTNILVYAYDRSAGQKHDLAVQLMEACWEYENGCLSIQVLQEFFVTVTRKIAAPLDPQTARQIVADLAQWRLHTPEASDLLQAIEHEPGRAKDVRWNLHHGSGPDNIEITCEGRGSLAIADLVWCISLFDGLPPFGSVKHVTVEERRSHLPSGSAARLSCARRAGLAREGSLASLLHEDRNSA